MNFNTVKSITIPEGSVKKITCDDIVLWEKPQETITFYIDGLAGGIKGGGPYTAIKGMTWSQWVESKYNTFGCTVENKHVYSMVEDGIGYEDGSYVSGADVIIEGYMYSGDL